ncbi:Hypothetical protein NTJ_09854 [Nesidiocoris tenuis]|uniref:Uncharacterized protein n=1 Tax=Nesidiocoris tenuis TaxID=355587 RepID=A0ABN7AXX6_9HEMI|nr:Hypothetical protein NTJ_09854 [Nesidiocoris tenuis]
MPPPPPHKSPCGKLMRLAVAAIGYVLFKDQQPNIYPQRDSMFWNMPNREDAVNTILRIMLIHFSREFRESQAALNNGQRQGCMMMMDSSMQDKTKHCPKSGKCMMIMDSSMQDKTKHCPKSGKCLVVPKDGI